MQNKNKLYILKAVKNILFYTIMGFLYLNFWQCFEKIAIQIKKK